MSSVVANGESAAASPSHNSHIPFSHPFFNNNDVKDDTDNKKQQRQHQQQHPNGFYYLTQDARDKLPLYRYKGSDLSLLYKHILSPLSEFLVQTIVPPSMAPNTVTSIGLVWMVSAYALYWWYVPNLEHSSNSDTPQWIFLYNAIAMLGYQTLDNMDGKQARRTNSSSSLGLLFDHGCDAVNSIFGSANWIIGMSLIPRDNLWQVWALVFGPFAMFYVATWEQYYTGELIMPIINGPNEGLMGGVLLSLTSFWYGSHYWQQTDWYDTLISPILEATLGVSIDKHNIPVLRNCDFIIMASSIGFLQEIIWKSITVTRRYEAVAAQSLLPFLLLAASYWVVGMYQPQLWLDNPRTSLHLAMILFVEMSTELMLAHVTAQVFHPWRRWQLLPLLLLTGWVVLAANGNVSNISEQHYFLTVYTWSIGTYLMMKCSLIIHEICNILQIWCFDIVTPYPSRNIPSANSHSEEGAVARNGVTIPPKPVKTVYLIRHAESQENARTAALIRILECLVRFQVPNLSDLQAAAELLNVPAQEDTAVSPKGKQQIATIQRTLAKDRFVESKGIQMVAHSPLIRACQTYEGMFGCGTDLKSPSIFRVIKTSLLLEKSQWEWTPMCYNGFVDRISDFEEWLWDQEEVVIVLVGHSQFFKAMLGLDFLFGNCDVWKVNFDLSARGRPASDTRPSHCKWVLPSQWSNLELKYECSLPKSE
jgi:ethanolaminephosphotransferase